MFGSIVVGTDGSDTAKEAVRQATELAKQVGDSIELVSAYEPVASSRLREEQRDVPADLEWMVNPREDVDATYADMRGAGYAAVQCPYDAFWGARYAIVADPDGQQVGLMSPSDEARKYWPPTPAPASDE